MGLDVIQSNEYTIVSEGKIAAMLSQFDKNIVYDIIKNNISSRGDFYNYNTVSNIVTSYEGYFKQLLIDFPSEKDQIEAKRYQIYTDIINILCNTHGLAFQGQNIQDLYSATHYLYDFLISNFNNNITSFFINFIIREKNTLYDGFKLNDLKKNKDSSTLYNKKLYKNSKLAVIAANIEYVIDNICVFDIPLEVILNTIYVDKNIAKFLSTVAVPVTDFFKIIYGSLFRSNIRPILISNIRMELQRISAEDINIDTI